MVTNNFDIIDPDFVKDLLKSDLATFLVAQKLRLKGHTVTLPPIKIRPDTSQIREYADSGDLLVGDKIVEVKQRPDLEFNSLEEFPYSTLIVDVKHHYDNLTTKPSHYIICNSGLNGAIIVPVKDTFNSWTTSTRWDRKRGRERTFYLVEKKKCKWMNL